MIDANIFSIIICKLSSWEEFGLIILFTVDQNLEINFYNAIWSFYQKVGL